MTHPFFSNFLSIDIYILWLRLDVEIYHLQPSLEIKRRTVFVNVWQIAVAQYLCIRIGEAEALQKRIQSLILGWSTRIGWLAVLVETSFVTDADAVGIVVTGMSAYLVLWTTWIEHAILRDVVVVADVLEASCLVAGFQLLYCEILVDSCGTAVDHNQVDFSWIFHCFLVINN